MEEERERERGERRFTCARVPCKYRVHASGQDCGYAITVVTFLTVQNADIRKITW